MIKKLFIQAQNANVDCWYLWYCDAEADRISDTISVGNVTRLLSVVQKEACDNSTDFIKNVVRRTDSPRILLPGRVPNMHRVKDCHKIHLIFWFHKK